MKMDDLGGFQTSIFGSTPKWMKVWNQIRGCQNLIFPGPDIITKSRHLFEAKRSISITMALVIVIAHSNIGGQILYPAKEATIFQSFF